MPHTETNKYTKLQLHEAFTLEHNARKGLEETLATEVRNLAHMRYARDVFRDKYLRLHIEKNVEVVGDMDESLNYYFEHRDRETFFTPSGGYYCTVREDDCVFIVFAWTNPKKWKHELKDMRELIYNIQRHAGQPIRYVGVNNILKNHSKDLGEGVYELIL